MTPADAQSLPTKVTTNRSKSKSYGLSKGSAPAAAGDGADTDRRVCEYGLVDEAGVVVQATRQAQVETEVLQRAHRLQEAEQHPHLLQRRLQQQKIARDVNTN